MSVNPSVTVSGLDLLIPLLGDPCQLPILADPAAWCLIKEAALRQGVAPLIAKIARPHLSPADQVWCDIVLMRNCARFEHSMENLSFVTAQLAEEGIEPVALKGPMLARRHYDPPFLRKPSIDIDLAVRERDLERSCGALFRAGYSLLAGIRESKLLHHHVALSHPRRPRVDLHFRLSHGAVGIRTDEFIERASWSVLPTGLTVRLMEPSDEIFYLMLHLASDRFANLFHFYELWRICRASPGSVRLLAAEKAVQYRAVAVAGLTDRTFRSVWGEPFLPDGFTLPKTWLQHKKNSGLHREFIRNMTIIRRLTLSERLRGRWLDLQATDTARDGLRLVALMVKVAAFGLLRGRWGEVEVKKFVSP